MNYFAKIFMVIFLLSFITSNLAYPQESQSLKLLALKKEKLNLDEMKEYFEIALKLKEQGLISEEEFVKKRTAYLQAQVSFQQALINFLGSEVRIYVTKAIKYQDKSGKKYVRVSLRYSSRELKELDTLAIEAEELFPLDFLKEIKDVYVSLKSEGKIISVPYESRISSLALEEEKQATFQLLKDVENLDVCLYYAGKNDATSVYLQKGTSANIVTVNSAQFSQEADLESQASYDVSLEKFTGEANIFKLQLINLPQQITYEFIEPETQARLSQIKFTEGVTSMKLTLKLYLPKHADEQVVIDKPIEFYALVLDNEQYVELRDLLSKSNGARLNLKEIENLKAGNVKLELIPRGVGEMEVHAVNLYHEIKVGEMVEMDITVKNTGTRQLNNIRIFADLPLNWRAEINPDLLPYLEQNKEKIVKISFILPSDVSVGDYEPRIKTECIANNKIVESEDKIVRIHISAKTNILGISLLITLLIGLLVGIVVFGIRLTRR